MLAGHVGALRGIMVADRNRQCVTRVRPSAQLQIPLVQKKKFHFNPLSALKFLIGLSSLKYELCFHWLKINFESDFIL